MTTEFFMVFSSCNSLLLSIIFIMQKKYLRFSNQFIKLINILLINENKKMLADNENIDLIARIKAGDQTAFEATFLKYSRSLKSFAFYELKSEELAEDALQEVFCKLWINREKLDSTLSLKGFLFSCLRNHILNIIRTRKNEILKNYQFALLQRKSARTTENTVVNNEIESGINIFLNQLPDLKKNILTLSLYSGLSNDQIAKELNVSIHTVKMYLSQSSRQLRDLIALHGTKLILIFLLDLVL